ncbi:MAG: hypothetical protein DRI36_03645, partial [Caldiserica bacterium]
MYLVLFCLFLFSGVDQIPYWAYDGNYQGARNISLGASGCADFSSDSIFYNPASVYNIVKVPLFILSYRIMRKPDEDLYPSNKRFLSVGVISDRGGFTYEVLSSYKFFVSTKTCEIKVNKYSFIVS